MPVSGRRVGLDDAERPAGPCTPEALRGAEPHGFVRVAFRARAVSAQAAGQRQLIMGAEQQPGVARRPGGFDGLLSDRDRLGDTAELRSADAAALPAAPG